VIIAPGWQIALLDFSMKYELEWKMDQNSFIRRPKGGRKLAHNLVDSVCRDTWTQYITSGNKNSKNVARCRSEQQNIQKQGRE